MNIEDLKKVIKGEVMADEKTRVKYSRDTSLFEVAPAVVVFPKDEDDVKSLVRFVADAKKRGEVISLTGRSAGTDMSGGPLTESIVVDFSKYFTRIEDVGNLINMEGGIPDGYAVTEPGVFYRDFEKETMKKGFLLPSYPASRELCALGGMIANDSGGEKTLKYGKTHDYVRKLNVVLADGASYQLKPLTPEELKKKEDETTFEGEIYRKMHTLLEKNADVIQRAKPKVSKNSAGYNLWDVWNGIRFDLTKLFTGSQGTLGMVTKMEVRLVKAKPETGMLIIFLSDFSKVTSVVNEVLPFAPSSFESFDDQTFKLALKYFWGFLKLLAKNPFSLALAFLPEFWLVLTKGMPKLILLVEFEEDTVAEVQKKLEALRAKLAPLGFPMRLAANKEESRKYWLIRRESFNLLRTRVKGKQTAPFIDDLIVRPEFIPEFLPALYEILKRYDIFSTVAGHIGDGNFHIIPLMRLADEADRAKIRPVADEVYALVLKYGGSITAEHNDGLIRSPYLEAMYGKEVCALFKEVKDIFDPQGIFNPGKKVNSSMEYAMNHIKRS
ncbi:MAG: FAD-binding oxidoreductase [Candidatus Paceibacterota bacterium]|jgi:FAD/FMN-containing dehydrogenase